MNPNVKIMYRVKCGKPRDRSPAQIDYKKVAKNLAEYLLRELIQGAKE